LFECFGTGTAAVVVPIVSIDWRDNCKLDIPTMSNKELVWKTFLDKITDIQYGRTENEWCQVFG
jgi:branched-subunit amino acid aminotransferase/4-amino-4-deoxychorismate lyase